MSHLLPAWPLFTAFLVASIALAVTPGPGVFYVVTRTVAQGRRYGLVSVGGVALGNLCNALGASLGLAALFAASSIAFSVVRYAGAAYLVYLGIQMLRSARPTALDPSTQAPTHEPRVFRDGFIVALFNPKTTLFYAAFLPQFVTDAASPMVQSMLLASIFVAIAAVTDACYVLAAGWVVAKLGRSSTLGAAGRLAGGSIFVGLGAYAALAGMGAKR